ncbi:hypothetical protein [Dactylosporangium sp. NPDC006015]|uniref:hypothetical protein n=1 Tax=Dactylosporangium sp. NPDC006015 TaxID=3154576 RepID=UPI0033AF95A8
MPSYQQLVEEALAAPVAGWDFTWLRGRSHGGDPSWSYPALARPLIAGASSLLDVDTGGGELLASLAPLPPRTVATESWAPNVPVAAARLSPLGVGALVFHLCMVSWQIPDFTVTRYEPALRRLHAAGPVVVHTHRFLIHAVR